MAAQNFRIVLALTLLLPASPIAAQMSQPATQVAQAQSARELRASLDSAKRQAAETKGLDAAYELIGIVDAAQTTKLPDVAADALNILNGVLERAAQAAVNAPVEDAQDILDQLVDLSFFARTSNITGADAVLQKSLRALFPKMISDIRISLTKPISQPEQWSSSLVTLSMLGELQAAATLVMMDDIAASIAQIYDSEASRLSGLATQIADTSQREKTVADLIDGRKIRAEQVGDARKNNLTTVAAEMAKPGRKQPKDEESAEASADLSDSSQACTEVGMIAPPSMSSNWDGLQDILPKLEEECVLSGRTPTENRCPGRNLTFVCRELTNESTERLIYVYEGTPEERTMREKCKGDRLAALQLTGVGAVFKNTAMRRILTCAPIAGTSRGRD